MRYFCPNSFSQRPAFQTTQACREFDYFANWGPKSKWNELAVYLQIFSHLNNNFPVKSFLVFLGGRDRVVTTNQVRWSPGRSVIQCREIFKILVVISYSRNVTDVLSLTGAIYTIVCQYIIDQDNNSVCKETTLS